MKCFSDPIDARGVITPFVSIIVAFAAFLNFVMHDHVMISYQVHYTKRLNGSAADSVLAQFDKRLSSHYGLYCIDSSKESELCNRYYEIMDEEGFSIVSYLLRDRDLDAASFSERDVTGLKIEFSDSIIEPAVLEKEISSLMKYKSVGNAAVKVVSVISEICESASSAGAASELRKTDAVLDRINEQKKALEKELSGISGMPGTGVNGFFDSVFAKDRGSVLRNVNDVMPGVFVITDRTLINTILDTLSLYCSGADIYGEMNKTALDLTEVIIELKREAEEKIAEAEALAADAEDGEELKKMIIERRKSLSEIGDYSFVAEKLSENYFGMQSCSASLNRLREKASRFGSISANDAETVIASADEAYDRYVKVEQKTKAREDINGEEFDLYEYAVDAAAAILDFLPSGNVTIPGDIFEGLPSQKDGGSGGADEMIDSFIDFTYKLDPVLTGRICSTLKSLLETGAESVMNEYFIDDYVCTYMKDTSGPKDINSHYLNGETEYIFAGSRSDDENMIAAYSGIYAIRFVMNVVHLLTNDEKREALKTLAEEHPAIMIATAAAWAALESALDIAELRQNKKVPLIKRASDWKISTYGGVTAEEGGKDGGDANVSDMSYSEYLRILLLLVPKQSKVMRILDVLELNYYKDNRVYRSFDEFYTRVTVRCDLKLDTVVWTDRSRRKRFDWSVVNSGSYQQ